MSTDGTWTGTPTPTITRKWQASATSGGTYTDIVGATGATYTPASGDLTKYIRLLESANNIAGGASQASNVVGPVAEAAIPLNQSGMERGANISPSNYYTGHKNFINIIRDSARTDWGVDAGSPTFSDGGATITLPPGAQVRILVVLSLPSTAAFRTGDYIIKAVDTPQLGGVSSMGLTLGVNNDNGLTSVVPGTRCTFTVSSSTPEWAVIVKNDTGSTKTFHTSNIINCHADDEALLDAGEIFAPAMKQALAGHSTLRFLDPIGTNVWTRTKIADLPTMQNWIAGDWPIEICVRLCKELGATPWINLPFIMDRFTFHASATTNRITLRDGGADIAPPWIEGDMVMISDPDAPAFFDESSLAKCAPLYVRNISGNTFQISATPTGSIIDITADVTSDTPPGYTSNISGVYDQAPIWNNYITRANAEWPDCPKWFFEASNETWNTGGPFYRSWAWCRSIGYWFANGSPNGTAAGYAEGTIWAHRKAWKLATDILGASKVRPQFNAQLWPGLLGDSVGTIPDTTVFNDGKNILEQIRDYGGEVALAPYIFPCKDTIGEWGTREDWTLAALTAASAQSWTPAQWAYGCANAVAQLTESFAQWQALVDTYAPGTKFSAYEMGQHMFWNIARTPDDPPGQIADAWTGFWFGSTTSDAQTVRESYLNFFATHGFRRIVHYVAAGNWNWEGSYLNAWGMQRDYYTPNEWSQTFNKIGTVNDARVFISGHSLTPQPSQTTPTDYCQKMAATHGLGYDYGIQNVPGSGLGYRCGPSTTWAGFSLGTDGFDVRTEIDTPTQVTGAYTHFLTTETHELASKMRWSETLPYLMAQYEAVHSRSPSTKFLLWSCWYAGDLPGVEDEAKIDAWIAYVLQEQKSWDDLVTRINLTLANRARTDRMYMAPANFLLATLVDKAVNGTLAGITKATFDDTIAFIFNNDVHLNGPAGKYYMDLMQYVCIYRRAPIGVWYPTTGADALTAEQALSLQQTVWDAFLTYESTKVERTMAQARTEAAVNLDAAQEGFLGAGNSLVDSNFFNRTTYTPADDHNINPYHFDAATDEASGVFFGVP